MFLILIAIYVLGSLILSAINVCISCILCWMVHGRYKVPKVIYNFFDKYIGKMSIPTKKTKESEAFESNLEKMRQQEYQSFSAVPIKFGRESLNAYSQMGDERREVELIRMNRLQQMSRRLLEEGTPRDLPVNNQANVIQLNESIVNENDKMIVKIEQLIKELEGTHKDIQKDNQSIKNEIQALQLDMHYLTLSKMQENIDAAAIGEQEMKQLAVILNRFTGIILTILNVGLIIYTGLTMFST